MSEGQKVAEDDKALRQMITRENFKGIASRNGFTRCEDGTYEMLNAALETTTGRAVAFAVLQAEHERHAGLNGSDAQKAIAATPEFPKSGYY